MEHNVYTGISDVRYFSPRLLAALTGILSSPLTVIEAPMGYGKTVAVREFLRRENLACSGFPCWIPRTAPSGAPCAGSLSVCPRRPETGASAAQARPAFRAR